MTTWILIFVILHALQISFSILLVRESRKSIQSMKDEITRINKSMRFFNHK